MEEERLAAAKGGSLCRKDCSLAASWSVKPESVKFEASSLKVENRTLFPSDFRLET
jgi:hypothetical protein